MRIAIITTMGEYPWAGSEELWGQTAEVALRNGHTVAALVKDFQPPSEKLLRLMSLGLQVQTWSEPGSSIELNQQRGLPPLYPYGALLEESWDRLLISHGGFMDITSHPLLVGLLIHTKKPFSVIVQANTELYCPNDRQRGWMREYYRAAEKVFFVSRHNRELAERQLACALPNATVINNPVNLIDTSPLPWKEQEMRPLACVARLDFYCKGQEVLLQILASPRWRERPWYLSLYGAGPSDHYFHDLIRYYNLGHRVFLRGTEPDVRKIWAENQLLVLPSRLEGSPLVVMEAMACGRPAVVTDVGGSADWVIDNESGFVAPAPTPALVEEALERAWNRRSEWRAMGARGHELFARHHAKPVAERLYDFLVTGAYEPSTTPKDAPAAPQIAVCEPRRISIVSPCYNYAKYLPEMFQSLVRQRYPHWELVIVNDESPDDTEAVSKELIRKNPDRRIMYVAQQNGGPAAARNTGIQHAKGDWILCLDPDDLLTPEHLESAVDALDRFPDVNLVTCDAQKFGASDGEIIIHPYDPGLLRYHNILINSSLYSKELWRKAGGYYEALPWDGVEDWTFWISCSAAGMRPHCIAKKLFMYRIHERGGLFSKIESRMELIDSLVHTVNPALYPETKLIEDHEKIGMGPDALLERLEKRIARFPEHHLPYFWRGLWLQKRARVEEAIEDFKRAVELAPEGDWQPMLHLLNLYQMLVSESQQRGDAHQAERLLSEVKPWMARAEQAPFRMQKAP